MNVINLINTNRVRDHLRSAFKHSALAVIVAAGLGASSAQALTTTSTYNLGPQDAGTSIDNQSILPTPWIPLGTLPVGSVLRSVSINARLDVEGGGDTWASDIFVYVDPGAPSSGSEILQVGGYDAAGSPTTYIVWGNGNTGALGTTCVATKTAPADFPNTIDLNGAGLFIGSRGYIPASWSGSITVEYDVPQVATVLTFGPGAVIDQDLKTIEWTVPYETDVTTLAPTFSLSSGSSDKPSGSTHDFTSPVTYTITDGATINAYTVTVSITPASSANNILAFGPDAVISGTDIEWIVPLGTDVTSLAPTYTVSAFATGSPVSGTTRDFTSPQTYTITAQDLSTQDYTVTVVESPWTFSAWTGDEDSGITDASPNTVAVNFVGGATSVNGVVFEASTLTGTNFSIGGGIADFPGGSPNVTGSSFTLASGFIYNGSPRTVTLTNLTPGATYETSLFAFGWEASGRSQTFASDSDSRVIDQSIYGLNQGIRIAYTFVADAASKLLTITPAGGGTFHMSALVNREVSPGPPQAMITSFGPGATIGPVEDNAADITWSVPFGSDVTALSPTFTLSSGATCTVGGIPAVSGETRNFTNPVHYIVTSSDLLFTTDYTVTVVAAKALLWDVAGDGDWDLTTVNWLKVPSGPASAFANNDVVTFNKVEGGTISIPSTVLPASTTVGAAAGDYTFSGSPIGGTGSLTMEGSGILTLSSPNTYSGATVVNSGTLQVSGNSAIGGSTSFTVEDGASLLLTGSTGNGYLWPANPAPLAGAGAVTVPAAGLGNVAFRFDMSAFTGVLNLVGGQFSVNPYFSPGFVAPVGGTINVENGTNLYLGWQGTTFTTTVKLSGGSDNGEGYGVLRGDTATLNGAVILATNSTIGSAGGTLTINAVISDEGNGYGFTTVGSPGTTVILTAENTYTGQTTVNGGTTLQCNAPNSLGGGALSINGKANLNYGGTKAVASLTLGGALVTVSGTYGSTASGASFPNDTYFTPGSTGTVTVTAASGFANWASANAPGQTPDQDHDNDGVDNGIEYFMGESGSSFTALPGLDGANTVTWTKDPAYQGSWQVQTSPDLNAWTNVAGTDNGTSVSYTLPFGLGKWFVRLLVTPTL